MPTAVITGASTGLGREFASLCAQGGHDLVITARSEDQLEQLAAEIRQKTGRSVRVIAKDLSDPGAPRAIFEETRDLLPEVDTLINNAGYGLVGPFAELDEDEQMRMVCLNIGALTHLTRLYLPSFVERRRGAVLNLASTAAFQPGPLMAVYFATKAYVVSFSEALHNEVRDQGVTVTALCPGATRTEFQRRAKMEKANLFAKNKVMDAKTVAEIGLRALKERKSLVVAGVMNRAMVFGTRFAPRQLAASMAKRMVQA